MINKFPEKYSGKWFIVYVVSLFISGIIVLSALTLAGILIGKEVFEYNMLILFFFIAIANFIICLIGFFNGKYIFLLSALSVLIGSFTSALLITEDYNGWEYFSGMMSLALYMGFGLIVGSILEVIIFIKNKKKSTENNNKKTSKKKYILLIIYIILLVIPLVTSLTNLDPKANKNTYNEKEELIDNFTYLIYSEGNNEYLIEILIDENKFYTYTEYYLDIDNDGEIYKRVNNNIKEKLSEDDYYELINFIINEAEFMEMPKDISTNKNILDAPMAFIELEFDEILHKKGGYYPFDNKDFKMIKDYLDNLYVVN